MGTPLSKDVIEGQRQSRAQIERENFVEPRQQRAESPARQEPNPPAVDARSYGTSFDGAQGSLFARMVERDVPLLMQKYFKKPGDPNNSQRDSKVREVFRRTPSKTKNRSAEQSARYTGAQGARPAGQARQSNFPGYQSRSRAGGSRSARSRNDDGPRRGNNRRRDQKEPLTEEEKQYLKERTEQNSPKEIKFEPGKLSRETFSGMGSATASDEFGMSELFGEKLLLVRKYLDHEFIQWDSKEQKADVMAAAETLRAVRAGGKPDVEGDQTKTASPTSGNGDEKAQALMQKLIAGEYAKFKKLGVNDVLGHVERIVHRNETFYPDDEESLLEKVKSIMPASRASNKGREARNRVTV